ncbi:hypothetical protein TRIUR3_14873 [Triticum urartu]|uniref:DUF569 domain-containing protein n=1 Tax=Triticum urartu TaxID=4572 RepID=M7YX56_TRIUA|nr:hypothetical protein TRIUR3_14873 [Triticum urartu]
MKEGEPAIVVRRMSEAYVRLPPAATRVRPSRVPGGNASHGSKYNYTGRGVSIDRRREMVNTAWVAQVLETDTNYFVLLRGAYGRFDEPEDSHVMWWTTPGKNGSVVLLHGTSARLSALRANGRYRRWHRRVTVEAINRSRVTSMMEWEVQVIPMRVERPPYQLRPGGPDIPWHQGSEETVQVNCVVADDNGSTDEQGREALTLHGRSLMGLGNELAQRLGDGLNFQDITLCIQAGNLAQPTVLLTNLPHRDDPVDIVVFRVGTPGVDGIRAAVRGDVLNGGGGEAAWSWGVPLEVTP